MITVLIQFWMAAVVMYVVVKGCEKSFNRMAAYWSKKEVEADLKKLEVYENMAELLCEADVTSKRREK